MPNHANALALIFAVVSALFAGVDVAAQGLKSSLGGLKIQAVASGFDVPWSFAFLPDGGFLVTERGGRLHYQKGGQRHRVGGTPKVAARGQGGLLDVLVPRDFARSREVFLAYSKRQRGGAGTALASARLSGDNRRLEGLRVIFEAAPSGASGGRHFGARIAEAPDGMLFLSLGERGDRPAAQDVRSHQGSVIRIRRDGAVPASNPFVSSPQARPEIWSFGHRNPQGLAVDGRGRLWAHEHGAQGGDEVNLIRKGANYGWPVIAYGRHYSGAKIGEGTARPGMEQPAWYWDPSIAPSGLMIYSGRMFPAWRGDFFAGSLKFDYISRLSGSPLREVEKLTGEETRRVRGIREAPDGSIWFISEDNGTIYRISR